MQRLELERAIEFFNSREANPDLQAKLIGQAWGTYQRSGPTVSFAIPFETGHRLQGRSRRLSIEIELPQDLPEEYRVEIKNTLLSIDLGAPRLEHSQCSLRTDEKDGGHSPPYHQ